MRTILGLSAALMHMAAPVVAQPDAVKVSRWPGPLAEPIEAGDMMVMVMVHDGVAPKLIDAVTVQPQHADRAVCAPQRREDAG